MRVFASLVILALAASQAHAVDCLSALGAGGGTQFIANADLITEGVLSGAAGLTVTVFAPVDGTYTASVSLAQLQYAIGLKDASGLSSGPFLSTTTPAGTVIHSLYTEYNLGVTPPPLPSAGQNGTQVVKVRTGFTVQGSPTSAPIKFTTVDQTCDNGAIHWYNATGQTLLTPPSDLKTVLHNLWSGDFPPAGCPTCFDGIVQAIDLIDSSNGGATWAKLNAIHGLAVLLPTTAALTAFETAGGKGVLGYMFSPAGSSDVQAVLSYHFLACPGQAMLYTIDIYGAIAASGAANFTTILGVSISQVSPPFPLQLSLFNSTTTNAFLATSFAVQTTPQTVGGTFNGANVLVDIPFQSGVIHGLNGFLLPTAVQLTLDKVVGGLQSGTFGVTKFIQYMNSSGLYQQLQNINIQNTLFVPSDAAFTAAFTKYPSLSTNATLLKEVLQLNIVPGIIAASVGHAGPCPAGTYATSFAGLSLVVSNPTGGAATTQKVAVSAGSSSGNIELQLISVAQNGMIYPTDTVLVMPGVPQVTPTAVPTTPAPTPTGAASSISASFVALLVALLVAVLFA